MPSKNGFDHIRIHSFASFMLNILHLHYMLYMCNLYYIFLYMCCTIIFTIYICEHFMLTYMYEYSYV